MEKVKEKKPHEKANEEAVFLERNARVRDLLIVKYKELKSQLQNFKDGFLQEKTEDEKKSFEWHTLEDDQFRLKAKVFACLTDALRNHEMVMAQQETNIVLWRCEQEIDSSQDIRDKLALIK